MFCDKYHNKPIIESFPQPRPPFIVQLVAVLKLLFGAVLHRVGRTTLVARMAGVIGARAQTLLLGGAESIIDMSLQLK